MIDFRDIRSGVDGQRGAFESLVCQLGHRSPPAGALEFRRIEGAGGDGGIEAYWLLPGGSEHGYQAKFHTRSSDVDWAALDASVETALRIHPALTTLEIALACDLTGPVAGRASSGLQRWETHSTRWKSNAAALGRSVEFVPCDATMLEGRLAAPAAAGLLDYWFGALALTPAFLRTSFDHTVTMLEERFQPEDHVDVAVRTVFDGLRARALLGDGLRTIQTRACGAMPRLSNYQVPPEVATALSAVTAAVSALAANSVDLATDAARLPDIPAWQARLRTLDSAIEASYGAIDRGVIAWAPGCGAGSNVTADRSLGAELTVTQSRFDELREALVAPAMRALTTRFAIITGRAGSGKSHLLASEVSTTLEESAPAIMLLGTDFSGTDPVGLQLLRRLDLGAFDFATFLGALDAAAETLGTRALIVIDAVNEGAGAALWRERLAVFADTILAHPRLALCISCRSEYAAFLLTDGAKGRAVTVNVPGFATRAEREASAVVYLDRRGIVRPATPWLSPEFANPLFLRTTCNALAHDGRTEFPRGLRGTREMLSLYLTATARHLGASHDGSDDLIAPLRAAVLAMARRMASDRLDYLERGVAAVIVADAFAGFAAPAGFGWLDLLRLRGILRIDPHPAVDHNDPLAIGGDVFRFAFQRFQDHLIAESLLAESGGPSAGFNPGGPLAFLLGPYGIDWQWLGVFQALAIQSADGWQVELVDALPGGFGRWWHDDAVQDAFVESVRWRLATSFNARSLELLNDLEHYTTEMLDLLLELSLVRDHPWNAEFLHSDLAGRPMAERDALWTIAINDESGDDDIRPAARIIDWASRDAARNAPADTIGLALTVLGWLCSSTTGRLRDGATKAAVNLLLGCFDQFPAFLARFAAIDDLYVLERVLAAGAGAFLRDPDPAHLSGAAASVYRHIFAGAAPSHLLLRDYGRTIVDLAEQAGMLPADVDIARCRPPYGAIPPTFGLAREAVDARGAAVGASSILYSCYDGTADFGRYIVESRIRDFSDALLAAPMPLTVEERYRQFRRDCVDHDELLGIMMDVVEILHSSAVPSTLSPPARAEVLKARNARRDLLARMPANDAARFATEALPYLQGKTGWPKAPQRGWSRIDALQAKLWVASRALDFGWTSTLFPRDGSRGHDRARATRTERIGKKYQWLAYYDLLARLTDNYWIAPEHYGTAAVYDTPVGLDFTRDIDPTVPPSELSTGWPDSRLAAPRPTPFPLRTVDAADMLTWVSEPDTGRDALRSALFIGALGEGEWATLYRFTSDRIKYAEQSSFSGAPFRQDEFHFLSLTAVKKADRAQFLRRVEAAKADFHEWLPNDLTDGPFLYEAGQRSTWPTEMWHEHHMRFGAEITHAPLSTGYHWESHLDGTLPEGLQLPLPCAWLLKDLALAADPHMAGVYRDDIGAPIIFSRRGDHDTYCIMRRDRLVETLDRQGLHAIWLGIGERSGWPDPAKNAGPRKRWNGTMILTAAGPRFREWAEITP